MKKPIYSESIDTGKLFARLSDLGYTMLETEMLEIADAVFEAASFDPEDQPLKLLHMCAEFQEMIGQYFQQAAFAHTGLFHNCRVNIRGSIYLVWGWSTPNKLHVLDSKGRAVIFEADPLKCEVIKAKRNERGYLFNLTWKP